MIARGSNLREAILIGFLLCIYAPAAYPGSGNIERLAVLELDAPDLTVSQRRIFIDLFGARFSDIGEYEVIDRKRWEALLAGYSDIDPYTTDEPRQLKIGTILEADIIVTGSLGFVGNTLVLVVKMIDIASGAVLSQAVREFDSMDDAIESSEDLIRELIRNVPERSIPRRAVSLEASLSYVPNGIGIGATYEFTRLFSAGIWAGVYWIEAAIFGAGARRLNVGWTISVGTNLIVGNKIDGFAVSIIHEYPLYDSSFLFSDRIASMFFNDTTAYLMFLVPKAVGIYYRGFFIHVLPDLRLPGRGLFIEVGYSMVILDLSKP